MSIQVDWDNDAQTIIRYCFGSRWTWDDLFRALDTVEQMSASVPHQVDAIIDFSKADLMPSGSIFSFNGQQQAQKLAKKANKARGIIVIAGANAFIRTVFDTFRKFNPNAASGVHFSDSVTAARSYLQSRHAEAVS